MFGKILSGALFAAAVVGVFAATSPVALVFATYVAAASAVSTGIDLSHK
jgi:hypothetical protein